MSARARVLLAADDEDLGSGPSQGLPGGVEGEAAVDGGDLEVGAAIDQLELGDGAGEELVLGRIADLHGGRQQQAAGAALGVGGQLGHLHQRAELGRGGELALANGLSGQWIHWFDLRSRITSLNRS
jgi:hypothetical protein